MLASVEEYLETAIVAAIDYSRSLNVGYNIHNMQKHALVKKTEYYNGTVYGVVVVDRSGIATVSIPGKYHSGREFVIVVTYEIGNHYISEFLIQIEKANRFGNVETQVYIDNVKCQYDNGAGRRAGTSYVSIHYCIDVNRLLAASNHSLYVENLDIIVSMDTIIKVPSHPYAISKEKPISHTYKKGITETQDSFYRVEIIDNEDEFGDRFINNNGKVIKITAKKDMLRQSGVYVQWSGENLVDKSEAYIHSSFDDFSVAEKNVYLFKSVREARDLGDIGYRQKQDLQEQQESLAKAKAVLEQKSIELKQLEFEAETAAQQIKIDKARRDRLYEDELSRHTLDNMRRKREQENEDQLFMQLKQEHDRFMKNWEMERDDRNRKFDMEDAERKREREELEHHRAVQLNNMKANTEQAKQTSDTIKHYTAIATGLVGLALFIYKLSNGKSS